MSNEKVKHHIKAKRFGVESQSNVICNQSRVHTRQNKAKSIGFQKEAKPGDLSLALDYRYD